MTVFGRGHHLRSPNGTFSIVSTCIKPSHGVNYLFIQGYTGNGGIGEWGNGGMEEWRNGGMGTENGERGTGIFKMGNF